jgi:hypothetical protein
MNNFFGSWIPRTLVHRPSWVCLWILLFPGIGASGQVATEKEIVELPVFTVQDSRLLPEREVWRYARIPGFEVLSNASDRNATRLIRDFQRFHQALVAVWPPADLRSALPATLILCGKGNAFGPFRRVSEHGPDTGTISLSLRDGEVSAIVIDLETTTLSLVTQEGLDTLPAATTEAPAEDAEASVLTGIPDFAVSHYEQLYREYIRFVLAQVQPRSPAWFEEGISQIFMRMEFSPTSITVGKVEDPNTTSITPNTVEDRDFNVALRRRALLPMDQLLSVAHDSPTARNALGNIWAKQAYAFVHLCLYSGDAALQKSMLTFLRRLGGQPPTEALFQECFGKSYKDMQLEIRSHADFTRYKAVQLRMKKGERMPDPPTPEFREATDAEVGRIKGDALRLAGNADAAKNALIAPYIRGEREPALLAAIGLNEVAAGDQARARKFLEAAAKAEVVRPRAYIELARLRLQEAQAAPAGANGRLSGDQVAAVLKPLFVARNQPPPLVELYETVAAAWSQSAVAPSAANLGLIDEGVRRFYQRPAWVLQAALLKAQFGYTRDAAAMVDLGLKVTLDPALRERFEALGKSLPPLPPEPAAPAAGSTGKKETPPQP